MFKDIFFVAKLQNFTQSMSQSISKSQKMIRCIWLSILSILFGTFFRIFVHFDIDPLTVQLIFFLTLQIFTSVVCRLTNRMAWNCY